MYDNEMQVCRIAKLRSTADEFLSKSLACTKISDVKAFFDLAQLANAEADTVESDLKIESCWTYLHFIKYFDYPKDYDEYMEFCVRNRLNPVSDGDFVSAVGYIATVKERLSKKT